MSQLLLNPGLIHLNFKRLIHSQEDQDKKYFKLLALGISDFRVIIKILEKLEIQNLKTNTSIQNSEIDLFVYKYLSNDTLNDIDFSTKHALALTQINNNPTELKLLINKLEKIFLHKIDVSSMTPSPIHFGPLEGFFSDSLSNIDFKTLLITVGFWFGIYGLIIYYFYF